MRVDVNSFVGAYPFRRVPGTSVEAVLPIHGPDWRGSGVDQPPAQCVLARPGRGKCVAIPDYRRSEQLRPVPAIHPGLKGWGQAIRAARSRGAPAVRC